jgi:hypothetical protein
MIENVDELSDSRNSVQAGRVNTIENCVSDKDDDFNLRDNQKQLDTSFCNVLWAVIIRRMHNYRRNKKMVFNEVILPCMIVVIGFILAYNAPSYQSPSRLQGLYRLP